MAEHLSNSQLGRYAEYFVKMEFSRLGFDIYTPEVDDKGIDFILRTNSARYWEVQVKSIRGTGLVCLRRKNFEPGENLLAVVAVFEEGPGIFTPRLFLIPSTDFPAKPTSGSEAEPSVSGSLLRYYRRRHIEKGKNFDEYQIYTSPPNVEMLAKKYGFEERARALR